MAGKILQANSPQNKPLQANTKPAEQGSAGRLSQRILRPAQALKQTAHSWPALQHKQQLPMLAASRHAGTWGGDAVVLAARKAGADLPNCVPTPPIAFACHCPYPLP